MQAALRFLALYGLSSGAPFTSILAVDVEKNMKEYVMLRSSLEPLLEKFYQEGGEGEFIYAPTISRGAAYLLEYKKCLGPENARFTMTDEYVDRFLWMFCKRYTLIQRKQIWRGIMPFDSSSPIESFAESFKLPKIGNKPRRMLQPGRKPIFTMKSLNALKMLHPVAAANVNTPQLSRKDLYKKGFLENPFTGENEGLYFAGMPVVTKNWTQAITRACSIISNTATVPSPPLRCMAPGLPPRLPKNVMYADCFIKYENMVEKYNRGGPKSANAITIQLLLFMFQTLSMTYNCAKHERAAQRDSNLGIFTALKSLLDELDKSGSLDITAEDIGEQGCWIPQERELPKAKPLGGDSDDDS